MLINKSEINIILEKDIDLFYKEINDFYNESLNNNKLILSIDFEFNQKNIALMQLSFEYQDKSKYYILYPPYLDNQIKNSFINKILINKNIKKVMHGCESLDIPYIYNFLLNNDLNNIILFTNSLYDTRYYCEYLNIYNNNIKKCSLYEALKNYKIIDDYIYKYLIDNEKNMGDIWKIKIDINNMTDQLIYYSIYDTIFLKKLFLQTNKQLKSINKFEYHLFNEYFRFTLLERNNITNLLINIISILNIYNNYYIIYNDNRYTLNDLFNNIFLLYSYNFNNIFIISKINYIKPYQSHIYRLFFYKYLLSNNKFIIYESKNKIIENMKINDNNLIDKLSYHIKEDIYKFNTFLDNLNDLNDFIK